MLLKRFESRGGPQNQPTGKVDLRAFIEFVRSRQPEADVEVKLRRIFAKAKLGGCLDVMVELMLGVSSWPCLIESSLPGASHHDPLSLSYARTRTAGKDLEQTFTQFGTASEGFITSEDFKRSLSSLGSLGSSLRAPELERLLKKLEGKGGRGRVALAELARLANHEGQRPWGAGAPGKGAAPVKPSAAVEEKLKRILKRAKDDGLSVPLAFRHFDKEGTGASPECVRVRGAITTLKCIHVLSAVVQSFHAHIRHCLCCAGFVTDVEFEQGLRQLGVFKVRPAPVPQHRLGCI
jgi:hypothetical protein